MIRILQSTPEEQEALQIHHFLALVRPRDNECLRSTSCQCQRQDNEGFSCLPNELISIFNGRKKPAVLPPAKNSARSTFYQKKVARLVVSATTATNTNTRGVIALVTSRSFPSAALVFQKLTASSNTIRDTLSVVTTSKKDPSQHVQT